jgi:hypothetical protein
VDCLKGRIACDARDAAGAAAALGAARRVAVQVPDPLSQARLAELSGRVELLTGNPAKAAPEFDREASLLRSARSYSEMTRALARAASAYKDAGDSRLAAERFFRAGRSAFGQGNGAEARKLLRAAIDAAEAAGDARTSRSAGVLAAEVEGRTVRPAED